MLRNGKLSLVKLDKTKNGRYVLLGAMTKRGGSVGIGSFIVALGYVETEGDKPGVTECTWVEAKHFQHLGPAIEYFNSKNK